MIDREIDATRQTWETERKLHEAELKERDATEKQARTRKGGIRLFFQARTTGLRDKTERRKSRAGKELQRRRKPRKRIWQTEKSTVEIERELGNCARKRCLSERSGWRRGKSRQGATERVQLEAKNRDELQRRQFEGERTC